jgi:aldehyde dehydrogenase (NAD+)
MIAMVCGDTVVWKPSSKVPLCAVAVHRIIAKVLRESNVPEGVLNLLATSSAYLGDELFTDRRIPLISFTGSTRTGKNAGRLWRKIRKTILELGGNNAIIVTSNANTDLALRAIVFGSVEQPDSAVHQRAVSFCTNRYMTNSRKACQGLPGTENRKSAG